MRRIGVDIRIFACEASCDVDEVLVKLWDGGMDISEKELRVPAKHVQRAREL